VSTNSGPLLKDVKNLDGSTQNLIFDVHQYIDKDFKGTSAECADNGVSGLSSLGDWLRGVGRQAFLSETGGGSTGSCDMYLCSELDWMNYHSDVYLGWIGWAAGSFPQSYPLSLTPTFANGVWTDTEILNNCVAGKFNS